MTENPFNGLYFALRSAAHRKGKTGRVLFNHRAVVWVLDPALWNKSALSHLSYKGGPLNPSHEVLSAYRPVGRIGALAPRPIALYGAHNSPRIVAQQGTFVLFGSDTRAMEDIADVEGYPPSCLIRIVITPGVLGAIRDAILGHGLTEATLFPDLDGLARDLRRTYGFDI